MRYALARRRARRRLLRRALVAKIDRRLRRDLAGMIGRRLDPATRAELHERTWCSVLGIPYEAIVPGSLHLGARRYTVTLARPVTIATISGTIEV